MSSKQLTPKQEIFVREYLVDLNATRAAKAAGYSEKTAEAAASRLLRNVKVRAEVEKHKNVRSQRLEITGERIMREVACIAFANMGDYLQVDGNEVSVDLSKLSRDQAAAIQGVTTETRGAGNKKAVRLTRTRLKLADKRPALELLGRWIGLDLKISGDPADMFRERSIEDNIFFARHGYFPEDAVEKQRNGHEDDNDPGKLN
jgi:phage terminase small subunit